jgi:hypothetical protein
VRATDVAGNLDPTPASVTVAVASADGGDIPVGPVAPPVPTDPIEPGVVATTGDSTSVTDTVAPRLTDARLRLRRGAPTLSVTASEAASLAIRLQRRVDGRWRTVRTLTKAVAAGSHRIKLARRVSTGKHRALVVATDPARNAGDVLRVALRR